MSSDMENNGRITFSGLFYGALALVAVVVVYLSGGSMISLLVISDGFVATGSSVSQVLVGVLAGGMVGFGTARLSQAMVRRFPWSRTLHQEFRGLLGPLNGREILAFALLSAVGEELLFRGALQPLIGVVPAALLFGALHIGPNRRFLPWPLLATVMGLVFGGLVVVTGTVLAPMAAHFVINYRNLHFINNFDPSLHLPRSLRAQDEALERGSIRR